MRMHNSDNLTVSAMGKKIQVEKYRYTRIGSILTEAWRGEGEIKTKISVVEQDFTKKISV